MDGTGDETGFFALFQRKIIDMRDFGEGGIFLLCQFRVNDAAQQIDSIVDGMIKRRAVYGKSRQIRETSFIRSIVILFENRGISKNHNRNSIR